MSLIGGIIIVLSGLSVDARVLPRANVGNQGSPLLLGPNGGNGGGVTSASAAKETSTSGNSNDNADDDEDNNTDTSASMTSTSSSSTLTQSSTSSTSTTTPSGTQSISSSMKTTSSSTSNSSNPSQTHENRILPTDPPKQPSSIRYLVPVFLLIIITIAGFLYQKYHKRKKRQSNRSSMAGKDFEKLMRNGNDPFGDLPNNSNKNNRGWKEIPSNDDEEEEIWDDKFDNLQDCPTQLYLHQGLIDEGGIEREGGEGGLIRSGEFVSANQKGWGWKESWNNFKSARGINEVQNQLNNYDLEKGNGGDGGLKKKPTIKLVQSKLISENTFTNSPINSYQNGEISNGYQQISHEEDISNEGEIDQLRNKSNSIPGNSATPTKLKLERSKSPNKRQSQSQIQLPSKNSSTQPVQQMPEAPEWIRSRSISPTNLNILSPPMQPHLFFQPPLNSDRERKIEPSFISEYSEFDDGDNDCNTICTGSGGGTPIPSPNPNLTSRKTQGSTNGLKPESETSKNQKMPRIPSTASGLAGIDFFSVVSNNKLQPNSNVITPKKNYTPSGLNLTSASSPSGKKESTSPLALKRSTALKNLSNPSSTSTSPSKLNRKKSAATLSPNSGMNNGNDGRVDKKTRVKKKEQKANNQVEDILKASWSDRALTSPPIGSTSQSFAEQLGNKQMTPGMMSPGLDQGGGGIEQRLALLRNVEL